MTNEQLYLAIVPMLFNTALLGAAVLWVNGKFDRFDVKLEAIDRRFNDMRDLWRAALHRVEEVLDARLKHLEESR